MRLPKNFNLLPKYISQDIYKKIGNSIAKEMMDTYRSSIKSFYNDYTPSVYRRRYRSYYFVDANGTKAYSRLVHPDIDGKGFSVMMNITSDNITVPYKSLTGGFSSGKALNELVFNNTFVLGQHGGRLPWNILPEDDKPLYPSKRWRAYKTGWVWMPPIMDTPPKAQIDKWFDDYTSSGKIDKLIDDIVTSSISSFLKNYAKQHMK